MTGFMVLLWFATSVGVMGYGVSNGPVNTLSLPRWTSLAVVGVGFLLLMTMFALFWYANVNDLTWFQSNGGRNGESD